MFCVQMKELNRRRSDNKTAPSWCSDKYLPFAVCPRHNILGFIFIMKYPGKHAKKKEEMVERMARVE